jgi:hypothetical protein
METSLCLLVLTSDEVCFATGLSDVVETEESAPLEDVYWRAEEKQHGKPTLMMSFFPLLNNFSFDFYVECMSEISGNVPNFGTVAVDHNEDYHDSRVLLNGESWRDRLAILLFYGPVDAALYVGSISKKHIFPEKGVVTASEGSRLKMVNGAPVIDYLLSLGLKQAEDGSIPGINSFPIILDYNDGSASVARGMFAITPEGHAVCGGDIPVGATLAMGSFSEDDIVETSRRTLGEALQQGKYKTFLMFSCIGRYFALGYNNTAELEAVLDLLRDKPATYMAAYSGGEFCPMYNKEGEGMNRNHGNSFILCAF